MSVTVNTQEELDRALADSVGVIYIDSPAGVWLSLNGSGSSHVTARGSSRVTARGSSRVTARGSSRVTAGGSSRVEAGGSSRVEAWGSSRVEARGSSRVTARDSSHVEAWDSSRVTAGKYVAVHLHSQGVTISGDGHVIDLTHLDLTDPATWCDFHGVTVADGVAELFKAVDDNWTTERGVSYAPGSAPEATDWHTRRECGGGLHLCAAPSLSLAYKPDATRFVRVGVRLDEMVTLDDKAKARRVVVPCVEVDQFGEVLI